MGPESRDMILSTGGAHNESKYSKCPCTHELVSSGMDGLLQVQQWNSYQAKK